MTEIYYVKPIDNSRLMPVKDPGEGRRHISIVLLAIICFTVVMLSAWLRFDRIRDGYQVESLERQAQQLAETNRELRLEQASLKDPLRVDTIARNQLGMTILSPHQLVPGESAPADSGAPILAQAHSGDVPPAQPTQVAAIVP